VIPTPTPNAYDAFGDIEQQAREAQEEAEQREQELNRDFYATFSTPAGRNVFNYFKKFTLDTYSIPPGLSYDQAAVQGSRREGQNDIIREIKIRAERGKTGQ